MYFKNLKIFYIFSLFFLYSNVHCSFSFPFNNPDLSWDKRVDDLVKRLTLDEVVSQSVALYQKSAPSIPRLGQSVFIYLFTRHT